MTISDEIERIRDIDDEIFGIFQEAMPHILPFIKGKSMPKTSELYLMYMLNSNPIKCTILDAIETDDFYSCNILFRALIEHYFRFLYIFTLFTKSKNDKDSEHYLNILKISEYLSETKAIHSAEKIFTNKAIEMNERWNELIKKFPFLSSVSKKQIENTMREFSIKNIIAFLSNEMNIKNEESISTTFTKFLLMYSELSSYIHGGYGAFESAMTISDIEIRQEKQLETAKLAIQIANIIKVHSFDTFSVYNNQFKDYSERTNILIKKL
ncbi:DUF5677 domain-containing protein [Labilibacter marinus]|uniref:DUF5677 domain-containing protein n=1 Tax=Labilibacter marinus TaxID=1477105 RepID=UPI00094FEAC8|nr:DUF5677 domain-containing protein [Labilibacter marinus]